MDWESTIENDGTRIVTLPEGDYEFTVTKFEKGWYDGSSKIPACPKAMLEFTIEVSGVGTSIVKENIYIDESVEWKICEFFRCIGLRKHGERQKMPWAQCVGKKGVAHISVNEYVGNDGKNYKNNKIVRFLDTSEEEKQEESARLPWDNA